MKKCDEVREYISLYIDEELDEAQLVDFEEHIRCCEECRNELDEIKSIISICSSIEEEELPDKFREELHSKLLTVKEEIEGKNKVVKLRDSYIIKIVTAVAACLLIVVLTRGFLNDGFFPKHSKNDIARTEMAGDDAGTTDESAEISDFSAKSYSIADDTTIENSDEVMDGVQEFSIMAEPRSAEGLPEDRGDIISRSTEPGERKHYLQRSEGENVYSNNIIINTKINGDLDSEVQNIKELVVDGGGEFSEQDVEIALIDEPVYVAEKESSGTVLNFKILYNQYQDFFDSLAEYIGSENITADKSSQDMSSIIESYNIKLNSIEDEISRIEKSGNTSSPDMLEVLKEERQILIDEIERIRLNSDYIFVTIYIEQNETE